MPSMFRPLPISEKWQFMLPIDACMLLSGLEKGRSHDYAFGLTFEILLRLLCMDAMKAGTLGAGLS